MQQRIKHESQRAYEDEKDHATTTSAQSGQGDMVERALRVIGQSGYQKRERVSRIEEYGDVE